MKPLAALLLALGLSGCAGLFNATVNTAGLRITQDIAYGLRPRQHLDLYQPPAGAQLPPVVVFLYGGGWRSGDKATYRFAAAAMARRGALVVVPDYRLYPQAAYPAFLQDCAAATAFVQSHAAAWGGDPHRVILAGHSAGAYNAAMLATDAALLAQAGGSLDHIAGFAGLAGPYDFTPSTESVAAIFPPQDDPAEMPVHWVDAHAPPMLLLAGTDDDTVRPRNTLSLAAHAKAAGVPVTTKLYPHTAHIGLVLDLAWPFRGRAPVLDDVMRFVDTVPPR